MLAENFPSQLDSRLRLKDGREVLVRPVKQEDGPLMVDLFNKLSDQSRYLRFLRHLHSIPEDMLYRFTHIDYNNEFAIAATIVENGNDAMIAVSRYVHTLQDNITELAVAIRDDWQHSGLGKLMLKKIVDIGKEHGFHHYCGMIEAHNKAILQILTELGYTVNYALKGGIYEVEILT